MRITQVSAHYRDARTALRHLHPSGGWSLFLWELKKEDIHGPGHESNEVSESHFIPSWIWTVQAPPNPPDLPASALPSHAMPSGSITQDAQNHADYTSPNVDRAEISEQEIEAYVMVDWAKAHEHAKRFEEEVELCVEEMRRTLIFFSWSTEEWEQCANRCASCDKPPSDEVLQGLQAYALHQSALFREMAKVFVSNWYTCLEPKGLGAEWLAQYSNIITVKTGWNKIPSIIPPNLTQMDVEPDDASLSDPDEPSE